MVIAIIVISAVLGIALVTHFVYAGLQSRRKRLELGLEKVTVKEWWQNHKPSKRRLIQLYAAILYNAQVKGYITGEIYKGNSKYMCVPGLNCYSCPGAVGACPLGALQNALRDTNRRAPYYMLGILAIFGLMLARTICGFLCPTGLLQDLLYKIRTPKLKKSKVTRVLSYFKYVLLIVLVISIPLIYGLMDKTLPAFCKYICPSGTFGGAIGLLANPSNASTLESLGPAFTWKFCVLVVLAVASVFIYRFFCRFICPLGAIYGFFNRIALLGVKLDRDKCTDCGLCVAHCKMDIRKVGDHECINCGECISVCPAKAISWKGSKIFVRGASLSAPAQEEVKPLLAFINQPEGTAQAVLAENAEDCTVKSTFEVAVVQTALTEIAEAEQTQQETTSSVTVKKKRGKKFWLELSAWIVALAVLVAALICFNMDFSKSEDNVITPPIDSDVPIGNAIGEMCPDFTLELYQGGGEYNLYENRGKITLINFWYIGCGGCEAEMPYIGELSNSEDYDIEIIAIHGLHYLSDDVDPYLQEHEWNKFDIKFAQDIPGANNSYQTFKMLGGTQYWPLTVILDEDGIVRYNSTNEFHSFEELKGVIDEIINAD